LPFEQTDLCGWYRFNQDKGERFELSTVEGIDVQTGVGAG
jgi:hypothetical protein